jgi:hypothetical protein
MRIEIEATNEKGELALRDLYSTKSMQLISMRARIEVTSHKPYTVEISQAAWSKLSAKAIMKDKYTFAAFRGPLDVLLEERNVTKQDYEIRCI